MMNVSGRRLFAFALFGAAATVLAACGGGKLTPSGAIPPANALTAGTVDLIAPNTLESCATLLPGDYMRCFAQFRTDVPLGRNTLGVLAGLTPPATVRPTCRMPTPCHPRRTVPGKGSGSSMPTMTPPPPPTWPSIVNSSVCLRARLQVAALRRSARRVRRRSFLPPTAAGHKRSRSISIRFRQCAQTVTSCSWKRTPPISPTSIPPRTKRSRWARR